MIETGQNNVKTTAIGHVKRQDGSIRWLVVNDQDEGDLMKLFFDQKNRLVSRWQDAYSSDELNQLKEQGVDINDEEMNKKLEIYLNHFLTSSVGQELLASINK